MTAEIENELRTLEAEVATSHIESLCEGRQWQTDVQAGGLQAGLNDCTQLTDKTSSSNCVKSDRVCACSMDKQQVEWIRNQSAIKFWEESSSNDCMHLHGNRPARRQGTS